MNKNFKKVNLMGRVVEVNHSQLTASRRDWPALNVDNINFEEIVGYIEYTRIRPWVLSRDNQVALKNDIMFSIIYDYFEKHHVSAHPSQVTKIGSILIDEGLVDPIDEDEANAIWVITDEYPPY